MLAVDRCLHELFADQVRRTPDAPALVDRDTQLTYAQLDRRARQLAARLRAVGVGPDALVGVLMERRADYVVACLAALQAGGAFLVLELAYPAELLADVLADAEPRVVVTRADHAELLPADAPRIVLDAGDASSTPVHEERAGDERPTPESLAFVSYSSGTTGRPKGIANPHRAAVRSYVWRYGVSDQRPGDRVACNVFFVWEMLRPLLRGATVYVIGDDVIYDPVALVRFLREHRITETLMTPSLLHTVLGRWTTTLGAQVPDLRVLWLNGEIVTRTLARQALAALPDARVLNVYSASETHEIAAGDLPDLLALDTTFCAVGRPLDPDHTYVLDHRRRPIEPGSDGELYVGGGCLARGYLNAVDRTAEAFVTDPFVDTPDARMYRTGDRARVVGDGALEITGRVGTMIKLRGYSIEPGAVEAAIERALAVRDSAVVADGAEGSDKRLVAYVVRESERSAVGDRVDAWTIDHAGHSHDLRSALADHLPPYMVPTVYVEVDALPVGSSGKVDLGRLPPPPSAVLTVDVERRDEPATVRSVAAVWAAVLEVAPSDIGSHDDFFDVGGHSLAVAELGTRLSDVFGVDVALTDLVAHPTPAAHCDLVRRLALGHDVAARRAVDLRAEAVLDPTVVPRDAGRGRGLADARAILLTGATGFLGAFLLDALVRTTRARVLCLVRADAPGSGDDDASGGRGRPSDVGLRRLRASLRARGLWRRETAERVRVVSGDLARPLFGMTDADFDALADAVDVIVHAGAQVNLLYPYRALRDVNVDGTREVLRLASRGTATDVHHISSSGVLPPSPDRWSEHAPLDAVAGDITDGYGQSKWVAEHLVQQARSRGLPAWIYRPGTISGHSVTGVTNGADLLNALVSESLRLGSAPDVAGWYAEMTPVDHVSAAICALAAAAPTGDHVFHLADPDPPPAGELFERLGRLGYPTAPIGWDQWVQRWQTSRGGDAGIAPVDVLRTGMPSADDLSAMALLDDRVTRAHLERLGLRRPALDDDLLGTYLRAFRVAGWLGGPARRIRV